MTNGEKHIEKLVSWYKEAVTEDGVCYLTSDDKNTLAYAIKCCKQFEDMKKSFDSWVLREEPSSSENPNKSETSTGSTIKNDLAVDCVSRKEVIDAINANCIWENEYNLTSSRIKKAVENLPSVTPLSSGLEKNSKKLEKNFGESDCISRADAIKAMQDKAKELKNEDTINGLCGAVAILYEMHPITPIRPKGHWIEYSWNDNGIARWGLECDKCHKKYKYGGEMWGNPNFCPNCGADMQSNTKRKGEPIEGNNESYNCENWIP